MYISRLTVFFIVLMLSIGLIANADSRSSDSVMLDSSFLQKLHTTTGVEARIDLVRTLEKRLTESSRITLEVIALDTKEDGSVRMQAICSLGSVATHESVPVLLNLLEDDVEQRRGFWACAISVLDGLKDRRAIPLLVRIANLREDHLAGMDHMAIKALAGIGDEREVTLLMSKAHIAPVRLAVIKGLARIASAQSTDTMIYALQEEDEPEIVEAAQSGLLKIGKAALPALQKSLAEFPDDWEVKYRLRIEKLIGQIKK